MAMKRVWLAAVAALTIGIAGVQASAEQMTLKGTVTDTMCPKKHMMDGSAAECVKGCVEGGADYALVSGDKVFTLKGDKAELAKFAAATVTVEGDVQGTTMTVKSIKAVPPK